MIRFATIFLAGATMAPITPQDDPRGQQEARTPSASDVVALTFRPQHLDPLTLYQAVQGMIGGSLFVRDDESGNIHQRTNL